MFCLRKRYKGAQCRRGRENITQIALDGILGRLFDKLCVNATFVLKTCLI